MIPCFACTGGRVHVPEIRHIQFLKKVSTVQQQFQVSNNRPHQMGDIIIIIQTKYALSLNSE